MIDKKVREALFWEIHKAIDEASGSVVNELGAAELSYPPGVELTPEENAALAGLRLNDAAQSGLKKLVADACAWPLFHFFSLMDGVADPEAERNEDWRGATIEKKGEGDDVMLHDELYETYWVYGERK